MSGVVRFSVSLEPALLEAFDDLVARDGKCTRSDAVKQLMREALVEQAWEDGGPVAGALVLVYDHHRRDLVQRLMDIQHDFGGTVISTQHVHLDHSSCLEVVTLKGEAAEIRRLVASVRAVKGLKHTSLVITATDRELG